MLATGAGKPPEPRLQRINITSPVQMLNITACEKCTGRGVNQDSVFCRSGKAVVTVFNESEPEVVVDSATAEAFCWDGTFGALLSPSGEKSWAYEKAVVTWDIQCELGFVLYNQCILSALVAIILMTFGSVVFVALVTALCLCFGLCNCCWVKRKFAMDEDETICCIFAPCDKGDPEARALHENPMAVRQRQKEEAEADDGLMVKI